jgi:hypothetical protein
MVNALCVKSSESNLSFSEVTDVSQSRHCVIVADIMMLWVQG